jgi:hypothetical protein
VKIKGTCKRCHREFLIEQAIANGGVCPWDGEPFSADYAVTLVDALREAAEHGSKFEHALESLADLHPAFVLDEDSVIANTRAQLARFSENLVVQG